MRWIRASILGAAAAAWSVAACAAPQAATQGVGAAPAQPQMHGPPAAAASLLATERAFAARSASAGAETAFREYVDPQDSRAFEGGDPIRGREAIASSHGDAGRLVWAPAEVFASQGGDMGTVWGLWSYTPKGSSAVAVTGRYVTVWRKDAAGAWKVIVDIGAPDAGPPKS